MHHLCLQEWYKPITGELVLTNHGITRYAPFMRAFYHEVLELRRMSESDVVAYRASLDETRVRGSNVPKPLKTWAHAGLHSQVSETLRNSSYPRPMPIQAQALPAIMSGRDCLGIAKTGAGKMLAFLLPMLRHVMDQTELEEGDGPIGLVLTSERERAIQICKELKKFRNVGVGCTAVYAGSRGEVRMQAGELERGTEVVVCTPRSIIEMLFRRSMEGKEITNLRRVTYLVMDDTDRMLDMGLEPQVMNIISNVRPERQTVMFSATLSPLVRAP